MGQLDRRARVAFVQTGAASPRPERDGGAGQLLARLYSDERTAAKLTKQGRRTARDLRFTKARVRALHQRLGIAACPATEQDSYAPLLSLAAADRTLGADRSTLHRRI